MSPFFCIFLGFAFLILGYQLPLAFGAGPLCHYIFGIVIAVFCLMLLTVSGEE